MERERERGPQLFKTGKGEKLLTIFEKNKLFSGCSTELNTIEIRR